MKNTEPEATDFMTRNTKRKKIIKIQESDFKSEYQQVQEMEIGNITKKELN